MSEIDIHCPNCAAYYRLDAEMLGSKVKCADCESKFFIHEDGQVSLVSTAPAQATAGEAGVLESAEAGAPKEGSARELAQGWADECKARLERLASASASGGSGEMLEEVRALASQALAALEDVIVQAREFRAAGSLCGTVSRVAGLLINLGQTPEALRLLDRLIGLLRSWLRAERQMASKSVLAVACLNASNCYAAAAGQGERAHALLEEAIELFAELVERDGEVQFSEHLARAFAERGRRQQRTGACRPALADLDRALEIYARMVRASGGKALSGEYADVLVSRALAITVMGRHEEALQAYDEALRIQNARAVRERGEPAELADLADTYINKAAVLGNLERHVEAVVVQGQAIVILEGLFGASRVAAHEVTLARACAHQAHSMALAGHAKETLPLFDRALEILARRARPQGTGTTEFELGATYGKKAAVLKQLGRPEEACLLLDMNIRLLEQVVVTGGQGQFAGELATAYVNRANAAFRDADLKRALDIYDRAHGIMEDLVVRRGWKGMADRLTFIQQNRQQLLEMGRTALSQAMGRPMPVEQVRAVLQIMEQAKQERARETPPAPPPPAVPPPRPGEVPQLQPLPPGMELGGSDDPTISPTGREARRLQEAKRWSDARAVWLRQAAQPPVEGEFAWLNAVICAYHAGHWKELAAYDPMAWLMHPQSFGHVDAVLLWALGQVRMGRAAQAGAALAGMLEAVRSGSGKVYSADLPPIPMLAATKGISCLRDVAPLIRDLRTVRQAVAAHPVLRGPMDELIAAYEVAQRELYGGPEVGK